MHQIIVRFNWNYKECNSDNNCVCEKMLMIWEKKKKKMCKDSPFSTRLGVVGY